MSTYSRFRHLLVAFDGSPDAKRGLDLAVDLALSLGAEITVLSVLPGTGQLETIEAGHEAERRRRAALEDHLSEARHRFAGSGTPLTHTVLHGDNPAELIAAHATRHGFDLIVIGSHGQEQARHGGLGRILAELMRDPRCPILVAPEARTD